MINPIPASSWSSIGATAGASSRAAGSASGDDFAGVLERVDVSEGGTDASTATSACTCGKGCASGWVMMDDASYFGGDGARTATAAATTGLPVTDAVDRLVERWIEARHDRLTEALLRSFASNARVGALDTLLDAAG